MAKNSKILLKLVGLFHLRYLNDFFCDKSQIILGKNNLPDTPRSINNSILGLEWIKVNNFLNWKKLNLGSYYLQDGILLKLI